MKRSIISVGLAIVLLLSVQTVSQAASEQSVDGNEYFCLGVMVGFVNGYVPGVRPILDRFTFSDTFFSIGFLTMEGLNDASGSYSIEDEDFGLEKIEATCTAYDSDKDLYLRYTINAVNIVDLGIIGTIELDGEIDYDDAGSAIGFFFGIRNILD